jgi:hypothetical protein
MKNSVLILSLFLFLIVFKNNSTSQNKWAYFGNTSNLCLNYIDIGNISISGNMLTVEAAYHLIPGNENCSSTPYHDIVSKHYDNRDVNYLLRPDHAEINTTTGFYSTNPVQISEDKCHHAAMVYDGRYLKFFLDSSFVDSIAVTGDLTTNSLTTKVGYSAGLNPNWFTQYWGYIDEIRLWTVARTEAQLKQSAFTNLSDIKNYTGLISYYDFQTGFENLQGNSNYNGSLVGDIRLEVLKDECIKLIEDEPEKPESENILITPNPVTDKLYIDFGDAYTKVKRIVLFNVLGQVVYQTSYIEEISEINMKNLITGIYFVNISFDDRSVLTEKIVKFDLDSYYRYRY